MIFCYQVPVKFSISILKYNYGGCNVDYPEMIHPCPRAMKVWEWILKTIKPESVIDPFLGSGTTAEVCEKLGIKWLGYEINEIYSQDIEKRLRNVKVEPRQVGLEAF